MYFACVNAGRVPDSNTHRGWVDPVAFHMRFRLSEAKLLIFCRVSLSRLTARCHGRRLREEGTGTLGKDQAHGPR
ncbi:hypothetical protein NDU88_000637 [Pleurodeles waltl]|uniref:Uncharacterized protein n=1 Tax=Pleurodeles waltl TaxID=8319 RepID=A0AAV7P6B1_PLEWA|nr:hypothetical protein NDU88_000637 [Pleurodeles waltl]